MMAKTRLGDVRELLCAGSSTASAHPWSWAVRSGHVSARCPDHGRQVRNETDAARRRQKRAEDPAWREKQAALKREPKYREQSAARQRQRRVEDPTWREKSNASQRVRSKADAAKAWGRANRLEPIASDETFLQLERARGRRYRAKNREAIADRDLGRGRASTPESREKRRVATRERYASDPQYRARVLADRQRRRARRFARERGAVTSVELLPLSWQDLAARDGWGCYICGGTCDPSDFDGASFGRRGPTYPTLDHVTPISAGGEHSEANARLACSKCNSSKGRRPLEVCVRRRLRLGRPVSPALLVEFGLVAMPKDAADAEAA
jgi:5-methylcytosine-specific restriction endonuclease McrA